MRSQRAYLELTLSLGRKHLLTQTQRMRLVAPRTACQQVVQDFASRGGNLHTPEIHGSNRTRSVRPINGLRRANCSLVYRTWKKEM